MFVNNDGNAQESDRDFAKKFTVAVAHTVSRNTLGATQGQGDGHVPDVMPFFQLESPFS